MAQAIETVTPIRPLAAVGTFYIPVLHDRQRGEYFPEILLKDCTGPAVAADIAFGQHERVVRVLAFDPASGKPSDVSAAIAKQVLNLALNDYDEIPDHCAEFLELTLGIDAVRNEEFEHRHAA